MTRCRAHVSRNLVQFVCTLLNPEHHLQDLAAAAERAIVLGAEP